MVSAHCSRQTDAASSWLQRAQTKTVLDKLAVFIFLLAGFQPRRQNFDEALLEGKHFATNTRDFGDAIVGTVPSQMGPSQSFSFRGPSAERGPDR